MTELSNVKLTISLKDTELNEEELDELTRNLRQQMNEVMQNLDEVISHKLRLPNICQESGLVSVKLIADKL